MRLASYLARSLCTADGTLHQVRVKRPLSRSFSKLWTVDRHWHAVFDADGSFLLPSMNDLQYMADKINDIRVHRLSTKTFPEELHWKEIRHCGHNMVRTFDRLTP